MTNNTKRRIALKNAILVNEGRIWKAHILISGNLIESITLDTPSFEDYPEQFDFSGKYIFPGMIDDQVHFREPGLTHKADIETESRACLMGGITTYFEMPNTLPPAITIDELEKKYTLASQKSFANYSFYLGASNDNIEEIKQVDPKKICGVKVFMGSSTGNLLVDDPASLDALFKYSPVLIAAHCEDEMTVKTNEREYRSKFGDTIGFEKHAEIRSVDACYLSSSGAVALAKKHQSRLHILHISTEKELELFDQSTPLSEKKITAEACVHHLFFSDRDYERLGWKIKWNPSIKSESDRLALIQGLKDNKIDVIATDHAPHTLSEKDQTLWNAPSGGPLVQHALLALLELHHNGHFTLPEIVQKTSHAPAALFRLEQRGYLREGYFADLVVVDLNANTYVNKDTIAYKCGWSPFEGMRFSSQIVGTFVNGHPAYINGSVEPIKYGERVTFDR